MTSTRLSNFFFDGNPRANRAEVQPVQDRTLTDRERFLVQAEKQRVERDRHRRLVRLATHLQAHCRGSRRRALFYSHLRSVFDGNMSNSNQNLDQLKNQTLLLRLFFQPQDDDKRLCWLCGRLQAAVGRCGDQIPAGRFCPADWPSWLTGRLLMCCLRTVAHRSVVEPSHNVEASLLRILERGVKTADEYVLRCIMPSIDLIHSDAAGPLPAAPGNASVDYTRALLQMLCSAKHVVRPRPADVSARLPGAHSTALFDLLLLPLERVHGCAERFRVAVHGAFALHVLCERPSLAARLHVLPALGAAIGTKFSINTLLDALLADDWRTSVDSPRAPLSTLLRHPFANQPYLLFGLLTLLRHMPTSCTELDAGRLCAALAAAAHYAVGHFAVRAGRRTARRRGRSEMETDDDSDESDSERAEDDDSDGDGSDELDQNATVHALAQTKLDAVDMQSDDYILWSVYDCLQLDHIGHILATVLDGNAGGSRLVAAIIHAQSRHVLSATNDVNIAHQAIVQSTLLRMCIVRHGGSLMTSLWKFLREVPPAQMPLFGGQARTLLDQLASGVRLSADDAENLFPPMHAFGCVLRNVLCAVHDDEMWTEAGGALNRHAIMPMSLEALKQVAGVLRNAALGMIDAAHPDTLAAGARDDVDRQSALYALLFQMTSSALRLLHERDQRLRFCGDGFWSGGARSGSFIVPTRMFVRSAGGGGHGGGAWRAGRFAFARFLTHAERLRDSLLSADASNRDGNLVDSPRPAEMRNLVLVTKLPFLVPFMERVQLFAEIVKMDKSEELALAAATGAHARHAMDADHELLLHHGLGLNRNAIDIRVRRTHLYEDAFDRLMPPNQENIKGPIRVQMTNWAGVNEPGIDGGGIFREFLNEVLKEIFDPARGLFVATPADGLLYPNALAMRLHADWRRQFFFAGRMLAKLIYERLMCELRFASCMIALLQRPATALEVHHLKEIDPVLYKNLLSLKSFEGDVSALHLDFSVVIDSLGVFETVDLIPDGRNVVVTNDNLLLYVEEMAKFYLNKQLSPCVEAVRAGLCSVLRPHWLSIFACNELQTLVSGADADLDVGDMRANTEWHRPRAGDQQEASAADDRLEAAFWRAVASFDSKQQRALLRFVTGCSRPPLTGFKDLHPKLGVQIVDDDSRLPTAATCMNLLKLPRYKDEDTLRAKLLYAISSGAGFELS